MRSRAGRQSRRRGFLVTIPTRCCAKGGLFKAYVYGADRRGRRLRGSVGRREASCGEGGARLSSKANVRVPRHSEPPCTPQGYRKQAPAQAGTLGGFHNRGWHPGPERSRLPYPGCVSLAPLRISRSLTQAKRQPRPLPSDILVVVSPEKAEMARIFCRVCRLFPVTPLLQYAFESIASRDAPPTRQLPRADHSLTS